jgi:hypothetical protein
MSAARLTWDLNHPRDLLDKLGRELDRLKDGNREDSADHALNFAVTAWHLTEWVWASIKGNYPLRQRLAAEIGEPATAFGVEAFQKWAMRSGDIAVCQAICTFAKHVGADRAQSYSTDAQYVDSKWDTSPWDETPWDGRYRLVIVDQGKREPAIPIFERALSLWTQFIHQNCARD